MKIRMVRTFTYLYFLLDLGFCIGIAEDYYRNDYPDEISSDGDSGWSYSDEDEEDDYMNDPQYAADNWS